MRIEKTLKPWLDTLTSGKSSVGYEENYCYRHCLHALYFLECFQMQLKESYTLTFYKIK